MIFINADYVNIFYYANYVMLIFRSRVCTNSDLACSIAVVKNKFNEYLLSEQKTGEPTSW